MKPPKNSQENDTLPRNLHPHFDDQNQHQHQYQHPYTPGFLNGHPCPRVLLYHHITPTGKEEFSISQTEFQRQIKGLMDRGFNILTLEHFDDNCREKSGIFITFDDGYEDIYHYAFPVLQDFGAAASVFLITDHIGKANDWEHEGLPRYRHLNENQINQLCAAGWEMHSHTASHGNFREMTGQQILSDVQRANETLRRWNQNSTLYCAFPFGRSEPRLVRALQNQGYSGAFIAEPVWPGPDHDRFHLPRFPVPRHHMNWYENI